MLRHVEVERDQRHVGEELALGGGEVGRAPLALGNGRYRYFVAGDFTTGTLQVTFVGSGFGTLAKGAYDTGAGTTTDPIVHHSAVGAYSNLQSVQTISVLGPTATMRSFRTAMPSTMRSDGREIVSAFT